MSLLGNILKMVAVSGSGLERRYKSAEAGDPKEQYHLGIHYERGQVGLPRDFNEAAKWYRKAAEQGHAGAQLYLGILTAQGQGVAQNLIEAYKWLELAKQGNMLDKAAAVDTQNKLVAYMTSDQIAQGKRLSSKFVPTKRTK